MRWLLIVLCCMEPALAAPLLPRCGPELDGQVTESGCRCRHEQASQLSAEPAGWRWSCDLLRGGPAIQAPADLPSNSGDTLPSGITLVEPGNRSNQAY